MFRLKSRSGKLWYMDTIVDKDGQTIMQYQSQRWKVTSVNNVSWSPAEMRLEFVLEPFGEED